MFRNLLEFGSLFDWVTPLVAGFLDIVHGPAHTFQLSRASGWSAQDVQGLLQKHGIRTWGLMIPAYGDVIAITVRQAQARWAQYLLQRHGIPIRSGLLPGVSSRSPAGPSRSHSAAEHSAAGDWIDRLGDLLWS
jgi:hypothetical protein